MPTQKKKIKNSAVSALPIKKKERMEGGGVAPSENSVSQKRRGVRCWVMVGGSIHDW